MYTYPSASLVLFYQKHSFFHSLLCYWDCQVVSKKIFNCQCVVTLDMMLRSGRND